MKPSLFLILLLSLFLLFSCSTTEMVTGIAVREDLSVAGKLGEAGLEKIQMTRPEVFYDGALWADELKTLLESAQEYIIYTVFLGSQCDEDQEIIDILVEKAMSGVPVYLVYDGTGTFDMTESRFHLRPLSDLKEYGIHLLEYNPFSFTRLVNLWDLIQREHRKFILVDGNQVAIGGMNLNYISLGPLDKGGQRDSMYLFQSADMGGILVRDFIDFYNQESWDEVSESDFPLKERSETESLTAYVADQYSDKLCMSVMFGSLVNSAQESVLSLPFLPYSDKNMLDLLTDATSRGVDFTMIVPFDSRPMPRKASSYMLSDLVKTGVSIHMENPSEEPKALLHEKLMVVDNRYVCFGSSNFNYRSMNLSNEIMIVLDDPVLAATVTDHYETLLLDTYVLTQEEADEMKTFANFPNFIFGFFGG